MSWCRDNLRDSQAWRDAGLPLTSASSEACRMFDAVVRQYVSWLDDDQLGGIEHSIQAMLAADTDFIMGKALAYALDLIGTGRTTRLDKAFAADIDALVTETEARVDLCPRERLHVKAVKEFAQGFTRKASETWETILKDHPTDLLALKLAHDTYFYLGDSEQIRDSIQRVLPKWRSDMPLYSYLKGMVSFGFEECAQYEEAESTAKEALSLQKQDCWATHSLAHVYEMNGRFKEGIHFLSTTLKDWEKCEMLACHNYWHWALYHLENGDFDAAERIFDRQVSKRAESGALLDIVDATSLLYRLKLQGRDVAQKWAPVYDICRSHLDDHILAFNDSMMCMAALGVSPENGRALVDSMKSYVESSPSEATNVALTRTYGIPLCEAMCHFDAGDFASAADVLTPIRDGVVAIGGSHAQRDVFNQLTLYACLSAGEPRFIDEAKKIVLERETNKPNSLLYKRIACQMQQIHGKQ